MTGAGAVFGVSPSPGYGDPVFGVSIGQYRYISNLSDPDVDIPMYISGPGRAGGYQTGLNRPINDVYFNEYGTMIPLSSFATDASTETAILSSGRNFQPLLNQWVHLAITYEACLLYTSDAADE